MAKFLCCRICLVEMERVKLADGSAVVVCGACDMIGVEQEVARGGPVWAAGMPAWGPAARAALAVVRTRSSDKIAA